MQHAAHSGVLGRRPPFGGGRETAIWSHRAQAGPQPEGDNPGVQPVERGFQPRDFCKLLSNLIPLVHYGGFKTHHLQLKWVLVNF